MRSAVHAGGPHMSHIRSSVRAALATTAGVTVVLAGLAAGPGPAAAGTASEAASRSATSAPTPPKVPVMTGGGGAVASVDQTASATGSTVLRGPRNAAGAALAMAGTLGVTEPYSSGIGGGGFF